MITLAYKPSFLRELKKLTKYLQEEAIEKIEELRDEKNHKRLRVHKLNGPLKAYYSFSINNKYRIVFSKDTPSEYALLMVGDHDIYK